MSASQRPARKPPTTRYPNSVPELRPNSLLPNRDHELTLQSDDGLTLDFLKDKIREPFPKRVSVRLTDLAFPRQYWIEVLEKKSGVAEVDAEIKKVSRIEIHSHDVKKLRLHLRPEMLSQSGSVRVSWNGKQVYEGPVQNYACPAASVPSDSGDPKLDLTDSKDFSLP